LAQQPSQATEPVQITVAEPATQPAAAPAEPAAKPVAKPVATQPVQVVKAQPKLKAQPVIAAQPKPAQTTMVQVPTRTVTTVQPKVTTVAPTTKVITVKSVAQPVQTPTYKTVTIATATPAPQPKTMAPRQSACRGASAISSKYLTATDGLPIRCGPQDGWNVQVIQGGTGRSASNSAPVQTGSATTVYKTTNSGSYAYQQPAPLKRAAPTKVVKVTPNTRIVPKHVYQQQVAATTGVYIPKGYKAVWDDDRLNPKRAHQTMAGKAQMELRWTNTVPRRLVDAATGKEVSYLYPGLQYPNTSYDQQIIAGVTVSAKQARSQVGQSNGAYYSGQRSGHTTVIRSPVGGYKYTAAQPRISTRSSDSYVVTGTNRTTHGGGRDR
jgi:hypothetical protein